MWIQEVLWIDLSPDPPCPRFLGVSPPSPADYLTSAQVHFQLVNSLQKKKKKRKGGSTQKCEMKKGELQKPARSLFDFLIAKDRNVTYRCEIPHPMKY